MVVHYNRHANHDLISLLSKQAMKKYFLSYTFHGEERKLTFDNLFEFDQALTAAMDNPHVANSTIDFYTKKP